METPAIGIDLGTTYCCVAILREGDLEPVIIHNDLSKNTTPSYVAYNSDESDEGNFNDDDNVYVTVGEVAKDRAHENPENTVFDVKRLIGRSFQDPHIQRYMHLWPFHLVNSNGMVGVQIREKILLPQQIMEEIMKYLLQTVQTFLGYAITSAVVTVPEYFNSLQRDLTREACISAGLVSVNFISEPTAASFAYGLQSSCNIGETKTCLIFDLGGGTFDVTVFTLNSSKQVEIKAIGGDARLGGEDFNDLLMEYCLQKFKALHGVDLADGKCSQDFKTRFRVSKKLRKIRKECERQKCFLSVAESVVISLDGVHPELVFAIHVTRQVFESLIATYLERCMVTLTEVLSEYRIEKEDIDEVVMIGGSTRIPKVQRMVSDFFGGKKLRRDIDVDEAVACGAAIYARNLLRSQRTSSNFNAVNVIQMTNAIHNFNSNKDQLPMETLDLTGSTHISRGREDFDSEFQNSSRVSHVPGNCTIRNESESNSFHTPPKNQLQDPIQVKLVLLTSLSHIYAKLVHSTHQCHTFEKQDAKDIAPFIHLAPPNVVIGKVAKELQAHPSTFNVVEIMSRVTSQMFTLESGTRVSSEEILSKYLEEVKRKLVKKTGAKIVDDVIIYPACATNFQRRRIIVAAKLAGFTCRTMTLHLAQAAAIVSDNYFPRTMPILLIHVTSRTFDTVVVNLRSHAHEQFVKVLSYAGSEDAKNQKFFQLLHSQLVKLVVTSRDYDSIKDRDKDPALEIYSEIVKKALHGALTELDSIESIYIIVEEKCISMFAILASLFKAKSVTLLKESKLLNHPSLLPYLFDSKSELTRMKLTDVHSRSFGFWKHKSFITTGYQPQSFKRRLKERGLKEDLALLHSHFARFGTARKPLDSTLTDSKVAKNLSEMLYRNQSMKMQAKDRVAKEDLTRMTSHISCLAAPLKQFESQESSMPIAMELWEIVSKNQPMDPGVSVLEARYEIPVNEQQLDFVVGSDLEKEVYKFTCDSSHKTPFSLQVILHSDGLYTFHMADDNGIPIPLHNNTFPHLAGLIGQCEQEEKSRISLVI